jgi:tRNA pseudouridine55 synthase
MNPWNGESLEFLDGQLILIDKPYGWTSFDVVKKIRYNICQKLQIKKIKVGHAGTLDPLATGLLIIATGKFTKMVDELMGLEKGYSGTIKLGATTPSYDLETEVDQKFKTDDLTPDKILLAAKALTGELDQIPPIFSAKKVDGKRAYKLARAGKEVELKSRKVQVKTFETKNSNIPDVTFDITCSKGTYIRSLARDLGLELDNGGHLTALRRESIGHFSVHAALAPDSFIDILRAL